MSKVRLVDDDESILRICVKLLRGHDLRTANNGAKALSFIRKEKFDVIVSDIMMPITTGEQLYLEVQQLNPTQASRMIFMTGDAFPYEEFLKQFPFFLQKPFNNDVFLSSIQRVLNG